MATEDSTLTSRVARKGRAQRGPKRDKSTSEYSSVSTDAPKLAAPPLVEEPRQLTFWRQRNPRRARQRTSHALYVREGNVFHPASSTQILECAKRVTARHFRPGHPVLKSPERARAFLQCRMANRTHEVFAVLLLDQQHRLIKYLELFRGTVDSASVYPREVVKEALAHGAVSVILAHNHPSGSTVPSLSDRGLTQKIKRAFAVFDIHVLDHLLVGKSILSFAEFGLL
jgi:DNA repair protein RadC